MTEQVSTKTSNSNENPAPAVAPTTTLSSSTQQNGNVGPSTPPPTSSTTPAPLKYIQLEPATPLTPDNSGTNNSTAPPPAPTPPAPAPAAPAPPPPPKPAPEPPPFVFEHESRLKSVWDSTQFLIVCVVAVVVPLRIGFNVTEWRAWIGPDILVDLFLWIDLLLNCVTTFEQDGETIRDRWQIFTHYILSVWFWLDLFSCIPGEFAHIGVQEYTPLYRANRLIRCFRLGGFFRAWERSSTIKPTIIRLLKSAFTFLFFCHFIGCVYYIIVRFEGNDAQDDFVGMEPHQLLDDRTLASQYFRSWYWAMAVMPGFNNSNPRTMIEVVFCTVVTLSGILFVATIIGAVGDMATNLDSSKIYFRSKMDEIDDYMLHRRLPKELQRDVQDYYNYLWKSGKALEKNDLLVELPSYLKSKMNLFLNREIVTKVPLFKQAAGDEQFISALIGVLRGIVCLPNFFVVRKGEFGTDMYFISRGELNVVSEDGAVLATLADGAFFGEIALMYDTKRTATIVARTYCDMFMLTKEDFKKVLRMFPEQSQGIKQIAQARFDKIVADEKKKEEAAAKARAEAAALEAAQAEEVRAETEADAAAMREETAVAAITRGNSMRKISANNMLPNSVHNTSRSSPLPEPEHSRPFHRGASVELQVSPKNNIPDIPSPTHTSSLPPPNPSAATPAPARRTSENESAERRRGSGVVLMATATEEAVHSDSDHRPSSASGERPQGWSHSSVPSAIAAAAASGNNTTPRNPPLPPLPAMTPGEVDAEDAFSHPSSPAAVEAHPDSAFSAPQ